MKITGKYNRPEQYFVVSGENVFKELDHFLTRLNIDPVRIFILADDNTRYHCLPVLLSHSVVIGNAQIIEIPSGEKTKSIEFAIKLWNTILAKHANRHSLLVNLGGGVISD